MTKYEKKDSRVESYELGDNFIRIHFEQGGVYNYTYSDVGKDRVDRMKTLAQKGDGLQSYIVETFR